MKCLVYETPIDTPEELVAPVAEAAAIVRETQSFVRRYQLCINVNGRHFQQPVKPSCVKPFKEPWRGNREPVRYLSHIKRVSFYLLYKPSKFVYGFFYSLYIYMSLRFLVRKFFRFYCLFTFSNLTHKDEHKHTCPRRDSNPQSFGPSE